MSSTVPEYAGCPWPMDPACATEEWNAFDQDVQDRALALASSTLNRLTAYRVSNCPVTVRPTVDNGRPRCYVPYDQVSDLAFMNPGINIEGRWVNNCGVDSSICAITLPRPVGRVYEVKLDGAVVPPSDYYLDDNRIMWRGEGSCPWPIWQDVTLPDTEYGTLSVKFLNAAPVDSLGAYAVGLLALEFARACTGGKCGLPKGVTGFVRAGVTFEINPGLFTDGFTGIRAVDAYIMLWNPDGAKKRQASGVWSPDLKKMNVQTNSGRPDVQYVDGEGA